MFLIDLPCTRSSQNKGCEKLKDTKIKYFLRGGGVCIYYRSTKLWWISHFITVYGGSIVEGAVINIVRDSGGAVTALG